MGKFFRKPQLPPPPPPIPVKDDSAAVKQKGKDAAINAGRRKGLLNTIKTTGTGDTSTADTERKTLLG
jgi:hypothetical protein